MEFYMVSQDFKIRHLITDEAQIECLLYVRNLLAFDTNNMIMRLRVRIKPFLLRVDGDFTDTPLQPQGIKRIVNSRQRNCRKFFKYHPVDILSRRVTRISFKIVEDCQSLWRQLEARVSIFFNRSNYHWLNNII